MYFIVLMLFWQVLRIRFTDLPPRLFKKISVLIFFWQKINWGFFNWKTFLGKYLPIYKLLKIFFYFNIFFGKKNPIFFIIEKCFQVEYNEVRIFHEKKIIYIILQNIKKLGPPALNYTPHLTGVGWQCRFWVISYSETGVRDGRVTRQLKFFKHKKLITR